MNLHLDINITMYHAISEKVDETKFLAVITDNKLNWCKNEGL